MESPRIPLVIVALPLFRIVQDIMSLRGSATTFSSKGLVL
jgi:hypothetical protein